MTHINYDQLYNVVVEWNDGASDILPLGGKYLGEDGNPYGFTHLEDAIKYRDAFLETSRKDTDSDAVRVSIIVGERVYR
jgi:hypothetical protein